ncbi:phenoloxidase-activating factor 2-like [Episyrphus balteatus]|uniref:phenoloxidase-activating factor 2-like n=1 Tax=Episyrphus balteatus TaxID=286459 RepID=UPI0024851A74|nr:phenoloxidase-activating factor 2-like [Episyrphus balteatus]XP_055853869.1 phenoloxidase-activating factor 2-like [Episyrphus balteatus]
MNAKLILIPIFLIGLCMVQSYDNIRYRIGNGFPASSYNYEPNPKDYGSIVTTKPETFPRARNFNLEYGNNGYNNEVSTCGYRNKNGNGKKVSNNEAEFGEFPWMVAILQNMIINGKVQRQLKCGGSLIARNVVLTAAHCVNATQVLHLEVRAGDWETYSNAEPYPYPYRERQVVEIIKHENFNADNLKNDIALLFLESEFDEAPHIKEVCLPPVNTNFDMSRCIASGWDMKRFGSKKYPKIMKIDLPVVPNAKCQNDLRQTRLGPFFELHSSFMCAGGEIGKDTCTGDGGSPLVCPMANNPDRYYQVGIVSWGIGCGDTNVPGVYASVPHLRSWIDKQLADKEINANSFTP